MSLRGRVDEQGSLLLLHGEVSAVISAMRSNTKWAVVAGRYSVRPKRKKRRIARVIAHNNPVLALAGGGDGGSVA
jgi:hypothetical protein